MRPGPHIPEADEALKALVETFRVSGGAEGCEALADGLLSRGHAGEARLIAEHGLVLDPLNPDARVSRAAALLAQGHPRMAYVELVRALALEPGHPRGLRLLGRVYLDAGLPERAAQLLSQRHGPGAGTRSRAPSTVDVRPLLEPQATRTAAPRGASGARPVRDGSAAILRSSVPKEGGLPETLAQGPTDIMNLFASLTRDLGLGPTEIAAPTRVEVTQVMRIRRVKRDGPDEALSTIDGPIVDSTQPGGIEQSETPLDAGLFSDMIQPPPPLGGLLQDDEPLFGDAVRASELAPELDTFNEEERAPLPMSALVGAIAAESSRERPSAGPRAERASAGAELATEVAVPLSPMSSRSPPMVEAADVLLRELAHAPDPPPAEPDPAYLRRFERASRDPEARAMREAGGTSTARSTLRERPWPRESGKWMTLSAVAAILLVLLVLGLAFGRLRPWIGGAPAAHARGLG